jgi:hypothetical protein
MAKVYILLTSLLFSRAGLKKVAHCSTTADNILFFLALLSKLSSARRECNVC